MYYCGIDTGTVSIGHALFNGENYIFSGVYDVKQGNGSDWSGMDERFGRIVDFFDYYFGCLKAFWPDMAVGIESPFVGPNRHTAINLGIAFGCVYAQVHKHGIVSVSISPAEAKRALTGAGNASKALMLREAQEYVSTSSYDEADAIGIALATRRKQWNYRSG